MNRQRAVVVLVLTTLIAIPPFTIAGEALTEGRGTARQLLEARRGDQVTIEFGDGSRVTGAIGRTRRTHCELLDSKLAAWSLQPPRAERVGVIGTLSGPRRPKDQMRCYPKVTSRKHEIPPSNWNRCRMGVRRLARVVRVDRSRSHVVGPFRGSLSVSGTTCNDACLRVEVGCQRLGCERREFATVGFFFGWVKSLRQHSAQAQGGQKRH
jgi:hypothetical protein